MVVLGAALAAGLEAALASMTQGEKVVCVVPADQMTPASAAAAAASGSTPAAPPRPCLLPAPPSRSAQVEVELQLLGLVQVGSWGGGQDRARGSRE